MPFNFYDTHTLLMAVQQLTPATTFLRDRYFPTNDASDVFATDDVLVEYRDGSKKLAPFVAPRKGGVTILRNGYHMERYTPPFVAPKRSLSADDLKKRGFGEALYTQLTPEQRQQTLILKDADELGEFITRREEAMAAETMLTNGCIMKHIADDADESDEMEIRFYSEGSNPATYAPTTKWDAAGAKILADLGVMARMLTSKGLRATDLICSPDVADTIVNNEVIQKLLDNKRYETYKAIALAAQAIANEAIEIARQAVQTANEAKQATIDLNKAVTQNTSKIQTLWDAVFSEITSNPFQITFVDLSGITLSSGIWNATLQRLEC